MTKTNQKQNSECIRVLLADDCPLILAGIHATVAAETDLIVVGEATDGTEAQHLSRELEPDVLLFSLHHPYYTLVSSPRWALQHKSSPSTLATSQVSLGSTIAFGLLG